MTYMGGFNLSAYIGRCGLVSMDIIAGIQYSK